MNHTKVKTVSEEKRQAILEAAVEIFSQFGYHHAKMALIAETAGVAAGSLYLYYKNKADLFSEIFEQIWNHLDRHTCELTRRNDLTPRQKMDCLVDLIFDFFSLKTPTALVFVNEQNTWYQLERKRFVAYRDRFLQGIDTIFQQGQQLGEFNGRVSPATFCYFIFGGLRRVLETWAHSPGQINLEAIRRDVKELIQYGIQREATLK